LHYLRNQCYFFRPNLGIVIAIMDHRIKNHDAITPSIIIGSLPPGASCAHSLEIRKRAAGHRDPQRHTTARTARRRRVWPPVRCGCWLLGLVRRRLPHVVHQSRFPPLRHRLFRQARRTARARTGPRNRAGIRDR
jgi:hypothetical protein